MDGFFSLLQMAERCGEMIAEIENENRKSIETAAKIVETEAKRVIGTYDYGWPQLAEATQDERERLGHTRNEPLLRTGEHIRDTIEHTIVSDEEAQIGSNSDIAVYQELGTAKIPARSFLAQAAIHKEAEIALQTGEAVVAILRRPL